MKALVTTRYYLQEIHR